MMAAARADVRADLADVRVFSAAEACGFLSVGTRGTLLELPLLKTTDLNTSEAYKTIAERWREPFERVQDGEVTTLVPWPDQQEVEKQLKTHLMLSEIDRKVQRGFAKCEREGKSKLIFVTRFEEEDVSDPMLTGDTEGEFNPIVGQDPSDRNLSSMKLLGDAMPANVQWLGQSLWAFANEFLYRGVTDVIVIAEANRHVSLLRQAIDAAKEDDHIYYGARVGHFPDKGANKGNQRILSDTVTVVLKNLELRRTYVRHALANLERWREQQARHHATISLLSLFSQEPKPGDSQSGIHSDSSPTQRKALSPWEGIIEKSEPSSNLTLLLVPGDWGDVLAKLTISCGIMFANLNMANAVRFGGAYLKGTFAQEENIFRRTDLHFTAGWGRDLIPMVFPEDPHMNLFYTYGSDMTDLINGKDGKAVYLSARDAPRVMVKKGQPDNYTMLHTDEMIAFHELRVAFPDLRNKELIENPAKAQKHREDAVSAMFKTLREAGIKHAVLSAIGCGVFKNHPSDVAKIFAEEIKKPENVQHFEVIAFAIFAPPGVEQGSAGDNFTPFLEAFTSQIGTSRSRGRM